MLKKLLLVSLLVIFLFAGTVQAQTDDLPEAGMLPDNPFYFLKSWSEGIGTLFTFGDVAKAERFLNLSEKRLAEANALVTKGKPEVAEGAIGRYQEHLGRAFTKAEEAKAKGLDVDEVLAKISEATLKHQAVLADVYERVPEQAKSAIQRAIQAGMRGHEEALKAVSGQKREEVMKQVEQKRQEVEQKLEGLRDKGIPIPTIPGRPETQEREVEKPEVEPETQEREVEKPEVESETPGRP
jgi:hypothetical protein